MVLACSDAALAYGLMLLTLCLGLDAAASSAWGASNGAPALSCPLTRGKPSVPSKASALSGSCNALSRTLLSV